MSSFRQLMFRNKGGGTKTLNATVVGNPTISDDFIVSNLSSVNYLKLPINFEPISTDSFKIHTKAKLTNDYAQGTYYYTDNCVLFDTTQYEHYGIQFKINNTRRVFSSTGQNGQWIIDTSGTTTINNNTWFYVDYIYSPSTGIQIKLSFDNTNWTTELSRAGSVNWSNFSQYGFIGYYARSNPSQNYSHCEFDMKDYYIEMNNEIIWQGVI